MTKEEKAQYLQMLKVMVFIAIIYSGLIRC